MRLLAAVLAVAAAAVHFAWTRPFRAESAAAGDEYRRLRDEKREATAALAQAARLADATSRVGVVPGVTEGAPAPRAARRLVVRALAASGVSTVRLRVAPGRPPVAATVHLTGAGSLQEVAALAGELARPGNGLVLTAVSLTPRDGSVQLSFDAMALGAR
jgi:hypothetical protein